MIYRGEIWNTAKQPKTIKKKKARQNQKKRRKKNIDNKKHKLKKEGKNKHKQTNKKEKNTEKTPKRLFLRNISRRKLYVMEIVTDDIHNDKSY